MITFELLGRRFCVTPTGYWYKFGYSRDAGSRYYKHTIKLSRIVIFF